MSRIIAIMPCRNSAWVLGLSARALLMWCDEIVFLDHASTDDTFAIMAQVDREHRGRVFRIAEEHQEWREMSHRQRLLMQARFRQATHIVTVDDDEVLTGNLMPRMRELVLATPPGRILQIPWLCMRGGIDQVQTGGIWGDQDVSVGFEDAPECHWAARGGYDFHHRHPMGRAQVPHKPIGSRRYGLMHLQFSSERRLRAKQALYKMTEVLRWPDREPVEAVDRRYNLAVYGVYADGEHDPHALDTVAAQADWWPPYSHLMGHLDLNAEPWQESECRRLWAQHGAEKFKGLDLFGVVGGNQ